MARDDTRTRLPAPRRAFFSDQFLEPLSRLRTELDQMFEDFPARFPSFAAQPISVPVPALEMTETDKAYKLTAELPGLKSEDVEVTVENGMVRISGEKKEEREEKEHGFMLTERSYGSFERRVQVPEGADPAKIKANFKDGVLTVTLPKDAKAAEKKRRIEIEPA